MNWRAIFAIARKDLKVVWQNKGVSIPIIILPLILFVVLPLMLGLAPALLSVPSDSFAEVQQMLDTMPPALRASLVGSLVLFSAGGVIGFLISGSNVRIPAHYHGCIVGVTLAMMGVVYLLLPRFGYATPASKAAAWQPTIYGVGQLMHIVGLVWSGGYGVQRKVAGTDQVLRSTQETLGMGLMGLGGLIAIVGGVMFIVIVLRALRQTRGS